MIYVWLVSLFAAIATGWLVFAGPVAISAPPVLHAGFLLSVCWFLAMSLWMVAREMHEQLAERRQDDRSEDLGLSPPPRMDVRERVRSGRKTADD